MSKKWGFLKTCFVCTFITYLDTVLLFLKLEIWAAALFLAPAEGLDLRVTLKALWVTLKALQASKGLQTAE